MRKMSVSNESARSVRPPTYAAVTPMIIEISVAIALTTTVTMSVSRVPQISCAKTSWPSSVVPRRCCVDGPREHRDEDDDQQDQGSGRGLAIAQDRLREASEGGAVCGGACRRQRSCF